jgi:hypothetical protein
VLLAGVEGNIVRHNIIAGNPPVQISDSFQTTNGVDIRNLATPGANTFEDNFCLTALNAPCPAIGRRDGDEHKDNKGDQPRKNDP